MQLFVNNALSALAGAIASGATTCAVQAGHGVRFPTPTGGDYFLLTLFQLVGAVESNHEIVKVTARSVDTLTIVRAQESTTARAWGVGDQISHRGTAGSLTNMAQLASPATFAQAVSMPTAAPGTNTTQGATTAFVGAAISAAPVNTAQAAADTAALNSAKAYADGLVVGLWDDRGNYDASVNTFPAAGGSGAAGAVLKGDIWTISVAGTLGTVAVAAKQTVRAIVDAPAQVAASWALGLANTSLDDSITAGITGRAPSQNAVSVALGLKTTATVLVAAGGAALVGNTPAGNIAAATVQDALNELDTEKAKLNGDGAQDFAVKSLNGGPLAGFRNRIINGNMLVNQRGVTGATTSYIVDRFRFEAPGGQTYAAGLGYSDGTLSLSGSNHIAVYCLSAKASLASGEYAMISHQVEGFNIADFKWGTAAAKAVTLSFRARASVAGTYSIAVRGVGYTRVFVTSVNVGTAPASYSVTIPGDTAGAYEIGAGLGMSITWCLASGSLLTTATPNTWVVGNMIAAPTQSNGLDTVNRQLAITDVQIELGSVATPSEQRSYPVELALCQRYFCKTFAANVAPANNAGTVGALFIGPPPAQQYHSTRWQFPVPMRASPSLTFYNPSNTTAGNWADLGGSGGSINPSTIALGDSGAYLALNGGNLYTPVANSAFYIQATASAEL